MKDTHEDIVVDFVRYEALLLFYSHEIELRVSIIEPTCIETRCVVQRVAVMINISIAIMIRFGRVLPVTVHSC